MNRVLRPTQSVIAHVTVAVFGIITLGWYASFVLAPSHIGDPLAYFFLLIAEAIAMSQLLGVWGTMLFSGQGSVPVLHGVSLKTLLRRKVSVAVFVPVAGEPLSVIRRTLLAARNLTYPHFTYVLDDGDSPAVRSLAAELGIGYLCRPVHDGKKAGNVNYALSQVHTDYFVIFDSDHVARPNFLEKTLPYLLIDPNLAFVQTPQSFSNLTGFISGGTAEAQEIFYRHILLGKNTFNAAFCVGTNVIFRRRAIEEIGGIYDRSNSEDIWTSILLHERGWRSLYLPEVLAVGTAPDTLASYFKQQFRWARGGLEIFFTHNPLFQPLSWDQKLQYLHSSMHFLSSVPILLFYLLPLLYVYFDLKPLATPEGLLVWARHFLPYYLMIFVTLLYLLGRWPLWRGLVAATAAFPAHLAAIISVVTGVSTRWTVTGVIRKQTDYVKSVAPQLLLLLLSLGAIPVLLLASSPQLTDFMVSLWLAWNSAVLLSVCKRAFTRFSPAPAARPSYSYASLS
jgi:cellulose synthase (UDP-forming)